MTIFDGPDFCKVAYGKGAKTLMATSVSVICVPEAGGRKLSSASGRLDCIHFLIFPRIAERVPF